MNPADPLVLGALASLAFLASLLGFVALGRAADRHRRGLMRARVQQLLIEWRRFVRDGGRARVVRAQARSIGDTLFWSALETLALELRRDEMQVLSEVLQRCAHVKAERRALRDESPWRRELAARRLGLVHCGDSRRALRRAMEQGPESVAFHAAFALARQRDGWALKWILDHPSYFESRPPRARTALLRAFGAPATPILAQRLAQGIGDVGLERSIVERLGAARHLAAAAAIRARVTSDVLELRIAAVRALSLLDPAAHLDVLVSALSDSAWEVRAQAARALGASGIPDAAPILASALSDQAWWVRRHSAYALTRLGAEGNAALRGEALVSPDRYARDMAREAIEHVEAKRVAPRKKSAATAAVAPEPLTGLAPISSTVTPDPMEAPGPPSSPVTPEPTAAPLPLSSAVTVESTKAPAPSLAVTPEPAAAAPVTTEPVAKPPASSPDESATPATVRPLRPRTPAEITAALRAASRRKRSA